MSAITTTSQTMSSLEIAKLTGKAHKEVLRDIRNILAQAGIDAAQFCAALPYGKNGNVRDVFHLPRLECDLVISGYSVPYRLAIIKRWHDLEAKQQPKALPSQLSTVEDRRPLVAAVNLWVQRSIKMNYSDANTIIHQRFGVEHTSELTVAQVTEAIEYVHSMMTAPAQPPALRLGVGQMVIERSRLIDVMRDMKTMQANMGKLYQRMDYMGFIPSDISEAHWQRQAIAI
jgi:Phage regulatory protein Rha (Phage_pRha)